jgi:hypothetical protein
MPISDQQLALLDETKEVRIRTRGATRSFTTIIWIVVADGTVYVRSVDGEEGNWYQRALLDSRVEVIVGDQQIPFTAIHVDDRNEIDAVSAALRDKYRPGGSLDRMVRDEVLGTTLRLDPTT